MGFKAYKFVGIKTRVVDVVILGVLGVLVVSLVVNRDAASS